MAIMFKRDNMQYLISRLSNCAGDPVSIPVTVSMYNFLKSRFKINKLFYVSDRAEFLNTTNLKRGDFYMTQQGEKYFYYNSLEGEEIKICEAGLIDLFGNAPDVLYFSNINAMKINNK